MQNNKIKSLIGLAARAGKLAYGLDEIKRTRKTVYCIITDGTLSEKSLKTLELSAEGKGIPLLKSEEALESILGKPNCKVAGVCDENFAKGILDATKTQ